MTFLEKAHNGRHESSQFTVWGFPLHCETVSRFALWACRRYVKEPVIWLYIMQVACQTSGMMKILPTHWNHWTNPSVMYWHRNCIVFPIRQICRMLCKLGQIRNNFVYLPFDKIVEQSGRICRMNWNTGSYNEPSRSGCVYMAQELHTILSTHHPPEPLSIFWRSASAGKTCVRINLCHPWHMSGKTWEGGGMEGHQPSVRAGNKPYSPQGTNLSWSSWEAEKQAWFAYESRVKIIAQTMKFLLTFFLKCWIVFIKIGWDRVSSLIRVHPDTLPTLFQEYL